MIGGEELRARREAAGLTRHDAALLAGLAKRNLARLETGRKPVTPALAAWLGRVYAGDRCGNRGTSRPARPR